MSPSAEFQQLILNTLVSDTAVNALIGDRVYDGAPADRQFPCATFGPTDSYNDVLTCIDARTETVQIDVWSRAEGRLRPCKEICDAIRDALHLADLSMTVNALVQIRIDGLRVFMDADGITAHGVVVVQADLEET